MSNAGTPTASTSGGDASQASSQPQQAGTPTPAAVAGQAGNGANNNNNNNTNPVAQNQIVMSFLERRGFSRSAQILNEELADQAAALKAGISTDEFAARNRRPRVVDAPAWESGFASLCQFVQGSLALHRNELQQTLWPIFVHVYLDLILAGEPNLASRVLSKSGPEFRFQQSDMLRKLGSIKIADHVLQDAAIARWRHERYLVPLTERGWGLLQGWLQGGGLLESSGKKSSMGDRGRDRILAIINERLELKIGPSLPNSRFTPVL